MRPPEPAGPRPSCDAGIRPVRAFVDGEELRCGGRLFNGGRVTPPSGRRATGGGGIGRDEPGGGGIGRAPGVAGRGG